jgi:hypothetical protein
MKVLMHFINKFFIWWCFIFYFLFWHYFDIFFESTFFMCDKCNVVISKVHYKSIIFLEFIQIFYDNYH